MRPTARISTIAVFLSLALALGFTATGAEEASGDDLARVAFLKFENKSGSKSYDWVTTSLPEAIHRSMVEQFEFLKTPDYKVQAAVEKHRKPRKKKRKKKKKKKKKLKKLSKKVVRKIAKSSQSEIVIYGHFTFNEATQQIDMQAKVYNYENNKIIGEVIESSPLDNKVFTKIDVIAGKIVDRIYKFALSLEKEAGQPGSEPAKDEKVRILVLVPTWQSDEQRRKAQKELRQIKRQLSGKYKARFLTLNEFFAEKRIGREERGRVNDMARRRDKPKILAWLDGQGVKDAFIVFVAENNVKITPVVDGKQKQVTSYKANATPAEKRKALTKLAKKSGIDRGPPKSALPSRPGASQPTITSMLSATSVCPWEPKTT